MALLLDGEYAQAEILPSAGGRVQRLTDVRDSRELLYSRAAEGGVGYLETTTGGWDVLFPNDEPWRGYPDHGVLWNAAWETVHAGRREAELRIALEDPPVDVTRSYALLPGARSGLRETIAVHARADTGPFLVAPHPMLAAEAGWRITLPTPDVAVAADEDYPGRFPPGALAGAERVQALTVPAAVPAVTEVLYVDGVAEATLSAPGPGAATRVSWDARALPHLWICTITGRFAEEAIVLLEPCTSRPYRLDEAEAAGTAVQLAEGETWSGWIEVEAVRHTPSDSDVRSRR